VGSPLPTPATADIQSASSAERILSTALDLFAVKGYDATSVREICEAAGITKPTLYHFFGSKDGVLQALMTSGFARFRGLVNAAIAQPGTFRHRMKLVARSVFESATTKPRFWRFMHGIVWAPPAAMPNPISCSEFYDGVVGALAVAADEAVDTGELLAGPTHIRMLILMGSISEAATGFVISGRPQLTPELADGLIDAIFDGWSAPQRQSL
jgi:AcrR family transcriptional regulator